MMYSQTTGHPSTQTGEISDPRENHVSDTEKGESQRSGFSRDHVSVKRYSKTTDLTFAYLRLRRHSPSYRWFYFRAFSSSYPLTF